MSLGNSPTSVADSTLGSGLSLHPELQESLEVLDRTVPAILARFETALEGRTVEETAASLTDPVQRAQFYVTIAFALHSVLFALLKLDGVDTRAPHIKAQLDRLRSYFEKVKRADDRSKRMGVDKKAAARFIKAALSKPEDSIEGSPPTLPQTSSATPRPKASPSSSGGRNRKHPRSD